MPADRAYHMEATFAGRVAQRTRGVLLQARRAHPHRKEFARAAPIAGLGATGASIAPSFRAVWAADATPSGMEAGFTFGVPQKAPLFTIVCTMVVLACTLCPDGVTGAASVSGGLLAKRPDISEPAWPRSPTHRTVTGKSLVALWIAKQTVPLQAFFAGVRFPGTVAVALAPAVRQLLSARPHREDRCTGYRSR